jgi:hypothetical protein
MLFNSKEIRWFTRIKNKNLIEWFTYQEQSFEKITARTDYYMRLPAQRALGIKWREGRMEIKQRTSDPAEGRINGRARGYFEEWVKWSFGLDEANGEYVKELSSPSWLPVKKERLSMVATQDDGKTILVTPDVTVTAGCQIEFTRLSLDGRQWYTFGLEWFGAGYTPLPDKLVNEILGPSTFSAGESMGYAEFLSKNFF